MPLHLAHPLLAAWVWLASGAPSPARGDPAILREHAEQARAAGQTSDAARDFRAALLQGELAAFFPLKDRPWGDAAVDEAMGDVAAADQAWTTSLDADPVAATIAARLLTEGPRRQALIARTQAHLAGLVKQLEAGGEVKLLGVDGALHALERIPPAEAIARLQKGEPLRYVYLPELDLSGLTVEKKVLISRSVVGRLVAHSAHFGDFYVQHAVVGTIALGQQWAGEVNKSAKLPASSFITLGLRETVVLGEARLEGVRTQRLGLLAFATFLGPVDLRGADLAGIADFRFASFASASTLRGAQLEGPAYLGGMRFDAAADLSGLHASTAMVAFNGAQFEGPLTLDASQFAQGATFEDARLRGPALLTRLRVGERLALDRIQAAGGLKLDGSDLEALDMFGARVGGELSLGDVRVRGAARFSLDSGQRQRYLRDASPLPALYRLYLGDEDADPAQFSAPAYGVRGADDLTSQFLGRVEFSDLTVDGRMILEGVRFGSAAAPTEVLLVGARINELHMERAEIAGRLDLTGLSGREVSLNGAQLDGALVLDDVNVAGRLSLTDLGLTPTSELSFRAASVGAFQIPRSVVERADGSHALFYERCALGPPLRGSTDPRLLRLEASGGDVRAGCTDDMLDEYSTLQDAFSKQALPADHDWAYWYQRHYATLRELHSSSFGARVAAAIQWVIFEKGFGWGVRLGNILFTALFISLIFSFIYRAVCHDTEVKFNGELHVIKNMSQLALVTMSLQSIIGASIGWEVMGKDRRFKYVNTVLTLIGIILITFFVGAYTRMVLA
jgi:uncharacterized protein YjbI with pentapeptide repeats